MNCVFSCVLFGHFALRSHRIALDGMVGHELSTALRTEDLAGTGVVGALRKARC